ncbi:MAG: YiiX family permuted papain-like enzyme [Spirochaetia bacterium]|nr:YiiX family permuted papain-like enzyme [Spirochaetia bacterium]
MKIIQFLILSVFLSGAQYAEEIETLVKDGDIIFNISRSRQSRAILLATKSKYSHVGIIFFINKKPFVLEAVQPVGLYSLKNWTGMHNERHYVVKRLKNRDQILTDQVISQMKQTGFAFKGKNYDGAFSWTDEKMYCSELVWKIYKRVLNIEIGNLKKIKDFDLSSPEMKYQLNLRYGKNIPYNEPVISPGDMFLSQELITVYDN